MVGEQIDWEEHVALSAKALGLSLEGTWKSGAASNLAIIYRVAALVDEFDLPDDIEPGPVFEA